MPITLRVAVFHLLRALHVIIALSFVGFGLVPFIRRRPSFDIVASSFNVTRDALPEGVFEDDPRKENVASNLSYLVDLPFLCILLAYVFVSWWLRFEGCSIVLSLAFGMTFVVYFLTHFWQTESFEWRFFSSRMNGIGLICFFAVLAGTLVFMVLFYKRQRMPFKFKSSLPIKPMGRVHIIWNFMAIFIVMYPCMLLWSSKMYVSWSCFRSYRYVIQLCEFTTNVQCVRCPTCTRDQLPLCFQRNASALAIQTCSSLRPGLADQNLVCLFNYNMSIYVFLTTFAYIGGLTTFLSTFLMICGHYLLRIILFAWSLLPMNHNYYFIKLWSTWSGDSLDSPPIISHLRGWSSETVLAGTRLGSAPSYGSFNSFSPPINPRPPAGVESFDEATDDDSSFMRASLL